MSLDQLWAGWRATYIQSTVAPKPPGVQCLFCALQAMPDADAMILERTQHTFTVMNAYPYTSGHVMVAPFAHHGDLTDLDRAETAALMYGIQRASVGVQGAYAPEGMNIGINIGRAGGAGVPGHVHAHVLPRWNGDTNFMTSVANLRVLPESLQDSYDKLLAGWPT